MGCIEVSLGDVGYKDAAGHFVHLRSVHEDISEESDVRCWVEVGDEWFEVMNGLSLMKARHFGRFNGFALARRGE
jgi:hypothetical protein